MSLRAAPENMYLIGTDSNALYLHLAITDNKYLVPRAKDPSYIDKLNEIISKEKIEFLHAQPDIEVEVVSENREKLNAPVFLPSKAAVKACQDKLESARVWKKKGVPVARTIEIIKRRTSIEPSPSLAAPSGLEQGQAQAAKVAHLPTTEKLQCHGLTIGGVEKLIGNSSLRSICQV
jgi:carbamoyl-phosphate synthase large subunit